MQRIPGCAEARVLGHRPQPELGGVRLADNDRTGLAQPADMGAVVVGDPVAERGASLRRRHPLGRREQVLHPDRDAAERPRVSRAHAVGLREGAVSEHGDERVHGRVVALDRLERRLDELARRDLARTDERRLLDRGEREHVSVDSFHGPKRTVKR